MTIRRACKLALASTLLAGPAAVAQMPDIDMKAIQKWESVTIVHYDVVGEIADKHVQIPPVDADLYADVKDKVTLSFDWDKTKENFVGTPRFRNFPASVSNLEGIEKGCPTGSIEGRYEHFDIVNVRKDEANAIELVGERIRPDTLVAEACGVGLRRYKGAVEPLSEHIAAPDPMILAYGKMLPKESPTRLTPDGLSIVMTALNNNWIWTYTPSPKTLPPSDLDDLETEQ